MRDLDSIMSAAPVIPVLVIERVEDAVPVAEALVAGGLPVLEVTLRTAAALDAIRAMKQVRGAIVGAGTVLNPAQFEAAVEAGSMLGMMSSRISRSTKPASTASSIASETVSWPISSPR